MQAATSVIFQEYGVRVPSPVKLADAKPGTYLVDGKDKNGRDAHFIVLMRHADGTTEAWEGNGPPLTGSAIDNLATVELYRIGEPVRLVDAATPRRCIIRVGDVLKAPKTTRSNEPITGLVKALCNDYKAVIPGKPYESISEIGTYVLENSESIFVLAVCSSTDKRSRAAWDKNGKRLSLEGLSAVENTTAFLLGPVGNSGYSSSSLDIPDRIIDLIRTGTPEWVRDAFKTCGVDTPKAVNLRRACDQRDHGTYLIHDDSWSGMYTISQNKTFSELQNARSSASTASGTPRSTLWAWRVANYARPIRDTSTSSISQRVQEFVQHIPRKQYAIELFAAVGLDVPDSAVVQVAKPGIYYVEGPSWEGLVVKHDDGSTSWRREAGSSIIKNSAEALQQSDYKKFRVWLIAPGTRQLVTPADRDSSNVDFVRAMSRPEAVVKAIDDTASKYVEALTKWYVGRSLQKPTLTAEDVRAWTEGGTNHFLPEVSELEFGMVWSWGVYDGVITVRGNKYTSHKRGSEMVLEAMMRAMVQPRISADAEVKLWHAGNTVIANDPPSAPREEDQMSGADRIKTSALPKLSTAYVVTGTSTKGRYRIVADERAWYRHNATKPMIVGRVTSSDHVGPWRMAVLAYMRSQGLNATLDSCMPIVARHDEFAE